MATNILASLGSLQTFANAILSDPSFVVITQWVNNPDASNNPDSIARYNSMVSFLNTKNTNAGAKAGIVLALDDGTVMYDNSKTNTMDNYIAKSINENHNSRPEILNAVLSSSGTGFSRRYSSSSLAIKQYYAVRLGVSAQANVATLRVTYQETL